MQQTKEVGGGSAVGLADNFVSVLQQLLNGGGIGPAGSPNAAGSTGNIMNVLSDILSAGGGKQGNAIDAILSKQEERDVNALRSRFGAVGGTGFGTPAAQAEAQYRADAAPRVTSAIGQLQLGAILPLLAQIGGLSQKGISQREVIQEKTPLGQAIDIGAGIGKTAASFAIPGFASSFGAPGAPAELPAPGADIGSTYQPGKVLNFGWGF